MHDNTEDLHMDRSSLLALAAGATLSKYRGARIATVSLSAAGGLPMGIQIVAPLHPEMECLQLAYAYDLASSATTRRLPSLISG
jgi:Asp-tRNA(Asn)/Glu-tRNA(Gln) amidotransferase A subunit family amidase